MTPYTAPGILTPKINPQSIITAVSRIHGVPEHEMTSSGIRSRKISDARHQAMFITSKVIKQSWAKLGMIFSRDHSSVIYAVNNVPTLCQVDKEYKRKLIECLHSVGYIGTEINKMLNAPN